MADKEPVAWTFPTSNVVTVSWDRRPDVNDIMELEAYLKAAKGFLRPNIDFPSEEFRKELNDAR